MEETKYKWNLDNKSTLLIIGNGFDKNLGLKTSYEDFLKSEQFINLNSEVKKNYFALHLQKENNLQEWVNVENEISKYAIIGDDSIDPNLDIIRLSNKGYMNNFKNEYYEIKLALKAYLKTQDIDKFDDYNETAAYKLMSKIGTYSNLYVLNFNYTLTAEKLIPKLYKAYDLNYENNHIIHIHGSLKPDDDIVFGVQDDIGIETSPMYFKNGNPTYINKIHNKLPAIYVCMYKSSSPYLNAYGINDLFDKCNHIIFFGYSLGITDCSYFKDFFIDLAEKGIINNKKIDIFYKDDNALDEINNRIRDLTDGKVLNVRKNHNVQLIHTKNIDKVYNKSTPIKIKIVRKDI